VSYEDKTLTCVDCGSPFTFTAGEQEFHASKGFTNEPRRCPNCRQARRASGGGGGGYSSGGGSYSGGGGYGQREFFTATCASCGREARVPFQPRGDKPVYCSDCFRSQSGGGSRSGSYGGGGGGRGGRDRDRW
jgi:CxxC-x17-CxxC domain-containing protein